MFKIIDRYILRKFIPLFVMSFVVCLFFVVMQFFWRYAEEFIGKGLSTLVLLEVIFHACLAFTPMALPLAILLSTVMTMGNLGESLELLAVKASGVRLYRIIRSLMLLITAMAVGLFVFSNTLMIQSQLRMWTVVITAKFASPEMELTPGVFYTGIPGYSLYTRDRRPDGMLLNLMVYDMSRGYLSPRIIRADSGRLVMDESKTFLILKLYDGQNFENLRAPDYNTSTEPTPYMLPRFKYSEIVINFDANIKEQDEGELRSMYVGKNLSQLQHSIDSSTRIIDSSRLVQAQVINTQIQTNHYGYRSYAYEDSLAQLAHRQRIQELEKRYTGKQVSQVAQELLPSLSAQDSLTALQIALDRANQTKSQMQIYVDYDDRAFYEYRTFRQEWHRKWTASVACIIFALIGASLGAIVRRGGIGMPIIISVFFFIIYFIIDSLGVNLVRSGDIAVWLGMWLSNLILAPVGIFLLYKANQDSSALNIEAYIAFFRKLLGFRGVRRVEYQEILFEEADYVQGAEAVSHVLRQTESLQQGALFTTPLWKMWVLGQTQHQLAELSDALDRLTEQLRHSSSRLLVGKLCDLPLLPTQLSPLLPSDRRLGMALSAFLPVSLPLLFFLGRVRSHLRADLKTTHSTLTQIAEEVEKLRANNPSHKAVTFPSPEDNSSEDRLS